MSVLSNSSTTEKFVLARQRDLPKAQQTVFEIKSMTVESCDKVERVIRDAEGRLTKNQIARSVLMNHIVGWTGEKEPWKPELANALASGDAHEIYERVLEISKLKPTSTDSEAEDPSSHTEESAAAAD